MLCEYIWHSEGSSLSYHSITLRGKLYKKLLLGVPLIISKLDYAVLAPFTDLFENMQSCTSLSDSYAILVEFGIIAASCKWACWRD